MKGGWGQKTVALGPNPGHRPPVFVHKVLLEQPQSSVCALPLAAFASDLLQTCLHPALARNGLLGWWSRVQALGLVQER